MRSSRESVLEGAFAILDHYGLGDLTMRRLAAELGVQPGGLYWHFANKQTLLAAMSEVIVAEARPDAEPDGDWRHQVETVAGRLRTALLAHPDGAELVAAGSALHPGAGEPLETMVKIIEGAGADPDEAHAGAGALLHFVLGHAAEVQAHDQLSRAGAAPAEPDRPADQAVDFRLGLAILLDGLATRVG